MVSKLFATKPLLTAFSVLVVVAIVVGALEVTNTTHIFHKATVTYPNPVNPHNQALNQGPASPNKDSGNSNAPSGSAPAPTQAENATVLQAPSGSFVSNHRPTLTGQPGPTEQSVCTTSPGASCVIMFRKAGVVKTLDTKAVDATGSASWSWELQDLGMTSGSWTITAKATLGSQTKSTTDPILLEVQP